MYPQYPPYPYYVSGGYAPDTASVYMRQQQGYYAQQYPPQPVVAPPPPATGPSVRRLPIKDPSTGLAIPVVTPPQVEEAVADYHGNTQPSDLVDFDLEGLFRHCKERLSAGQQPLARSSIGLQSSADFVSNLLVTAATKGYKFSQYYVGRCYDTGKGLSGEQSSCYTWFWRASQQYVPEATYKLAQCKEDGWGCDVNVLEAVALYKEAADAHVAAAQLRLGVMYEQGLGVQVDQKEAVAYYKLGIKLPEARFHVGRCYDYGIGTVQDNTLALKWYKQAKDLGFRGVAKRIEELQAVVGKAAEEEASGNNSPVGIPPPRAKPAGVKPDPKARPFTPGANGLQQSDSSLSRAESSSSARPDPRARPFVPVAAKLKQGDGLGSDNGGVKSDDASAAAGGQLPRAGSGLRPGSGGQLKAQAQVFQPKQQPTANQKDAPGLGTPENPMSSQQEGSSQSSGQQSPDRQSVHKSPAKSQSKSPTQQPAKQQSGPVEDLDELHTLQMSAAWSELDNSTSAEPPHIQSIKAAIKQARRYQELRARVKLAESFLARLERGAEMRHSQDKQSSAESSRQQDQPEASEAAAAVPEPQQSPGKESPGKQKQSDSRPEAVPELTQQVEAPEQAESTCQPEAPQQSEDPRQPESPQVAEALSPERLGQGNTAALSDAIGTPTIKQQLDAALGAQKSHPQLPLSAASGHSEGADDTVPLPQQDAQPQHAADYQSAAPAETAAAAVTAPNGEPHTSTSTQQGAEPAAGMLQTASAPPSADNTSLPDQVTSSSKSAEVESQPVTSSAWDADKAGTSSQAGGDPDQKGDEAAPSPAPAAAAAQAPSLAPSSAPAAAGGGAPAPGSMQDFLSFLLPAENPSAAAAMSSRATPPTAPSRGPSLTEATAAPPAGSQGGYRQPQAQAPPMAQAPPLAPPMAQAPPQPSRRVKPYTSTARAPAAPYRPPSAAPYRPPVAVYDPTQTDAGQPHKGSAPSKVSSLQAENSGLSDASTGLDREQSTHDVLADILGGLGGTPPRSARPSAPSSSQGVSRDASRSPAPSTSPAPAPRYQPPPLSPQSLNAEASQEDSQDATSTGATSPSETTAPHEQESAEYAAGSQDPTAEGTVAKHEHSAADQPSSEHAQPSVAAQKQHTQPDTADSAQADSGTQASESGSQQDEEDGLQQSRGGWKVRAVDADYNVSTVKAGRKAQAKLAKKSEQLQSAASNTAASVSQEGDTQQQTSTGVSHQPEASTSAILPPKPKPGAPKARKAFQPGLDDAVAGVSQAQGATPPPTPPPSGVPEQAAPQRPAPQQPQAEGLFTRGPSVQPPCAPSPSPPIYKPAPAPIPLPPTSAWAKKLDLQPVLAPKTVPIARPIPPPTQPPLPPPAAAATPRPEPPQPAAPSTSLAPPSITVSSSVKASSVADRPSSAGTKGKSKAKAKKKRQGQGSSQQDPAAQPSAPGPSAPSQRGSAVKEVPALSNDSRPRASDSTVLTAPGLVEQQPHTVSQEPWASQQRDVKKEKEGAMNSIMQDGMRVTEDNKKAWRDICECPLSLEIMKNPVVAADGITYEREVIQRWMNQSNISPWTKEALQTRDLTPNLLVTQLIQQFKLGESQLA